MEKLGVPSLYRIHEKPDPKRMVEFEETAAGLAIRWGSGACRCRPFTMKGDRREQRRGGGREARTHEVAEEIPVTPQMYQG